jgi:hypothetical protein
MRRFVHILVVAAIAATPASAKGLTELRAEAFELYDDCTSAWFHSSRKKALDRLMDIRYEMLVQLNPLSPLYDYSMLIYESVEWRTERCLDLVYPENDG